MRRITFFFLLISIYLEAQNTQFGVHWGNAVYGTPPTNFNTTLNNLQNTNQEWIRCEFSWGAIQSQQNTFNWYNIAGNVNALQQQGYKIIGMLRGTPGWYTTNNTGDPLYDPYFAPQDTVEWGRFIDSVMARFGGTIRYWEVWNEPDGPYLVTIPNTQVQKENEFLLLLKSAYHRIKAAGDSVLAGGLTSRVVLDKKVFFDKLFADSAFNYSDIINLHLYEADSTFITRDSLFKKMQDYGIMNKPIWITETNPWRLLAANGGNSVTNTANYLCTWLRDTIINYFNPRVICWFNLRNWANYLPGVCDNCLPDSTAYGLLDSSFAPTPVLAAYSNCIASLSGMEDAANALPSFLICPNPFHHQAILFSGTELHDATLIVCNALGQEIMRMSGLKGRQVEIKSENLSAGLYFVAAWNDGKWLRGKFIAE